MWRGGGGEVELGAGMIFFTLRPRSNVWINSAITRERAADYAHS